MIDAGPRHSFARHLADALEEVIDYAAALTIDRAC